MEDPEILFSCGRGGPNIWCELLGDHKSLYEIAEANAVLILSHTPFQQTRTKLTATFATITNELNSA